MVKKIAKKIGFFAIPIVDFAIADCDPIVSANCNCRSRSDLEKMIADRDRRSFDRQSLMLCLWVFYAVPMLFLN